ncbi:MAG: choice-of-anchor Q domain-containing protein [Aggregatilineales bacterium]
MSKFHFVKPVKWMVSLLAVIAVLITALFSAGEVRPAHAATIVVNNTSDNANGCLQSGVVCLRNAINNSVAGDTITFASTVTGTILIKQNFPFTIDHNLTIVGPGATVLAIDGGTTSQVFNVNSGVVTISGLTIQHGYRGGLQGGGIANNGTLTLNNCNISNNTAPLSGGEGGGIANFGTLTLTNSNVSFNSANAHGGGIVNESGATLTISNSTIDDNTVVTGGGGIYNPSGATVTVTNSTIAKNTAGDSGGHGGSGGGILNAGTLTIGSTIVAGDSADTSPDLLGTVTSQGNNLVQNTTGASGLIVSDQTGVDPLLNAAALNPPGTTETMSLQATSPAIGKGNCALSPAVNIDQRGVFRKNPCDVGAYETPGLAFVVNSTSDDPATCAIVGTICLRNAVNSLASGGTVTFAGNVTGSIILSRGTITPLQSLTLSGPGAGTLAIDGNNAVEVLYVSSGLTVSISNLTIRNGKSAGGPAGPGGGIYNAGTLTITNSSISGNSGDSGSTGGIGGGIFNQGALTVSNSTVSGNSAAYGGGIANRYNGTLTISNSTIFGNSVGVGGGGIFNDGPLTIDNSTVSSNSATTYGGGIFNQGTLTVNNSTVFGNSVSNSSYGFGGGIYSYIYMGAISIGSTIVAANTSLSGPDVYGAFTSQGYNLVKDPTGSTGLNQPTDQTNLDPLLNPLALNSPGTTQTMSLQANSPAIGSGSCTLTPVVTTDQRGVQRKNPCDVGAYETINPSFDSSVAPGSIITLATHINTSANTTVTFTNGGTANLNVSPQSALHAPLSASPSNSFFVTPGNSQVVTITCAPTAIGTSTQSLTYTSDDPHRPFLGFTVTCTGVNPLDTIGVFRSGTFYLRLHNTTGFADISVAFNPATRPYPVVGDWAGAGFDTIGVFDQSNGLFSLRNTNTPGTPDEQFVLGNPNDVPLSGKWMAGAAHFGGGVFRPSNGLIYLKNNLTTGFADDTMVLGIPGDVGLAGDWNGKGFDSPGVYRASHQNFYLSNQVCNCAVFGDYALQYGVSGDTPVVGDWIAQGHDGVGLFRQSNGYTYLRNTLTTGFADITFVYGIAGDVPVAGHWQLVYPPVAPIAKAPPAVLVPPTAAPISTPPASGQNNGLGD